MTGRSQKAAFLTVGFFLLWFSTCALQMVAMETQRGPDRSNAVQVPLFLLVLTIPVASYWFRRRRSWVLPSLALAQLGLYVLYETGVSIETNIRADLLLVYPAILVSAWLAFRAAVVESGERNQAGQNVEAVPSDRTKCDACGAVFPSHFYLQAGGTRGFICRECAEKP